MTEKSIKVRFCPSPTGYITLGNTRTALFNALYAKSVSGINLLRIEDTDQTRSDEKYTKALQEDLTWLGLEWQEGVDKGGDNGPYFQSQRQHIYDRFYQTLEDKGLAYPCFCSEEQLALTRKVQRASGQAPRYPGTCRHLTKDEVEAKIAEGLKPTIRFKIPTSEVVEFTDLVKGVQKFNTDDIGDFIIRRADGTAPFMYCNAIDDALMGVTHVIRGEDHLTNSPRQMMILQALELPVPQYCHVSLIVGSDNTPLSKRHGSKSIQDLRAKGYFPMAINNYLARLGHYYENPEYMDLAQLAEHFNLENLNGAPAKYDESQLNYWQKTVLQQQDNKVLWQWMKHEVEALVLPAEQTAFVEAIAPNVTFVQDAKDWAIKLFTEEWEFSDEAKAVVAEAGEAFFLSALSCLEQVNDFKAWSQAIKETTGAKGKQLFQPLRIALSGVLNGPDMAMLFDLIGIDRIKRRITRIADDLIEQAKHS